MILFNKKQITAMLGYCERTFYRYLALTPLTIDKGLFTQDEVDEMEVELKKVHKNKIKKKLPPNDNQNII